MGEKLDSKETVSFEEALQMEITVNQALIDLLISKGVITEEELLDKIKQVKLQQKIVTS